MITAQQWQAYRTRPDQAMRERLVAEYAPLARYVVDRLGIYSPTLGDEDLVSQAIVGLIEAIDRYDPGRGVKFETYAYYRIRGAVMDMVREMDLLPRSVREKQAELREVQERLLAELGRQPRDEELASVLGITVDELNALCQDLEAESVFSLDQATSDEDGGSISLVDTVADEAAGPEEVVVDQDQRRVLAEAIDGLPESDRQVISLYYYEGLTMKEIGQVLGVTESRVCQIHSKALVRLKAAVAAQEQVICR